MPRPDKAIQYFNENAEKLSAQYNGLDRAAVHAELIRHLPAGPLSMLDVGAGSGADANFFAALGHQVLAAEPAEALRDIANKTFKNKNITWCAETLPALAAVTGGFDVVYAVGTLQYLDAQDRPTALARMAALLNDGGLLEIQYPTPPTREYQFDVDAGEMASFVAAFNKAAAGRTLTVVYQQNVKDFTGRKALNGQDVYFNTTILKCLKTPKLPG